MQLPFHNSAGAKGARQSGGGLLSGVILGAFAVIAWLVPAEKGNAVFGRLNYFEFWLAVALTAGAVSVLAVSLVSTGRRRAIGFRVGAVWVGVILGLPLVELAARFLPVRNQMDNPWYLAAGGGVSESDELPFERPAHLKWTGSSRGDLALVNHDPDPYARTITFATDWEGFHNNEDISEAGLITIGDSYTEAGNVPEAESFTTLLGKKLNLKSRNLGRAGYSPPPELIVLKKHGLKCRPKIVIWQIAESNDLDDARRFQSWVVMGRPPYFDLQGERQWERGKAWEARSATYRIYDWLRPHPQKVWPYDGRFRDHAGVERTVRFMNIPRLDYVATNHSGWPILSQSLAEGAALCRSNHIQLVIVLVPQKYRILGPRTQMLDREIPTLESSMDPTYATTMGGALKLFCASLGVPFVDATGRFAEWTHRGELIYLPYDTHLSPLGHEVLADLVAEKLMSTTTETPAGATDGENPKPAGRNPKETRSGKSESGNSQ
jgi:hypothetical protein